MAVGLGNLPVLLAWRGGLQDDQVLKFILRNIVVRVRLWLLTSGPIDLNQISGFLSYKACFIELADYE